MKKTMAANVFAMPSRRNLFVYSSSDQIYYHIGEQLEQAYSIGMKFKN